MNDGIKGNGEPTRSLVEDIKGKLYMQFQIKYLVRHIDLNDEFGDTKTETVINSDGKIFARFWNHYGPNNHYCMIERATGAVTRESVEELCRVLIGMIGQNGQLLSTLDSEAEILLEKQGIKISITGALSIEGSTCGSLIDKYLENVNLKWETVC